ncbi:MAG TPA: hypothetical protein VIY48_17860 [Candidatus Paceibacterota bacterium]
MAEDFVPEDTENWWNSRKGKLGMIATIIAVVAGSLTIANQAQIAEPHWLATRSFVRDYLTTAQQGLTAQQNRVESRQITTQMYIAKSDRNRIENEIANKQVLLTQNPNMPDPVKYAIQEQIRSLNVDLESAKSTYEDLKNELRLHNR